MAIQDFLVIASLVLSYLAATSSGATFSSLRSTLVVSVSTKQGQVRRAGEENITVIWSLDHSLSAGTDSAYKTVKIKLCYAPVSQQDRGWRKTVDNLDKDKTCQHKIAALPYRPNNTTFTWKVSRDVPTATYFIRAYVYDAADEVVAYGQTTDAHRSTNLFEIQAISGCHVSLDIASICFSAFSVVSLVGFFYQEKRKSKSFEQK